MSDTVTVKWRGREVTVELVRAVGLHGVADGTAADLTLSRRRSLDLEKWLAFIELPDGLLQATNDGPHLDGWGPTAQEAVDALQTKLDAIVRWARGEEA